MDKSRWLFALGGIVLGAVITIAVIKLSDNKANTQVVSSQQSNTNAMNNSNMNSMDSMKTMDSIMASKISNLKSKTGEEFDKAFIDEMTMHHQSAIDMANIALTNANRQEIKTLASNIITAQQKEISQMNQWMQQWYGSMK